MNKSVKKSHKRANLSQSAFRLANFCSFRTYIPGFKDAVDEVASEDVPGACDKHGEQADDKHDDRYDDTWRVDVDAAVAVPGR